MISSLYHRALKLLCYNKFGVKTIRFCYYERNVVLDAMLTTSSLSICMAKYHSQIVTSYDR